MKRLILLLMLALPLTINAVNMGVVDRTATRDTLAIPFQFLDTLGESVDDATNDSVYILVWSPGGTEVFRDSMLASHMVFMEFTLATTRPKSESLILLV